MSKQDSSYKTGVQILLEQITKDLDKLPVKDAVFSNYDTDITRVVEFERIQKLQEKYSRKLDKMR